MIHEIIGDLLDFPSGINIIVHQTNCQNCFGAGIALSIKKMWPAVFAVDSNHYEEFKSAKLSLMGSISTCVLDDNKAVVNLYAQNLGSGKKRATNYEAFARGLDELKEFCEFFPTNKNPVIGFPKFIGCGLGGGSWSVIKAMLQDFAEEVVPYYQVYIVGLPKTEAVALTKAA